MIRRLCLRATIAGLALAAAFGSVGAAELPPQLKSGVVLTGDLYHYPAERTLGRLPTFEVSEEQTKVARADVDEFLKRTGAQLWIQHDLAAFRKMKLSPLYYD